MTDKIIGRLLIVEGDGGDNDCERCILGTKSSCREELCTAYNGSRSYFINDEDFKGSK